MPEFDIKAVWPGWEIVRLIGRGSFGAVYEIERDNYGHKEKAALKVISIPQSASAIDDIVSDEYDKQRTVLAREEGFACIIFMKNNSIPISGWVSSEMLVYNYS